MSIHIYRPYFYIIQHTNSGKYYAGVKYAKNANPNNILRPGGYQTSSSIVKQIILEEGLDSFIIRKIKIFETGEDALDYETRFLRKVNAAFNNKFLNMCNNSPQALNVDYEKSKQTCLKNFGVEYPMQSPEVREKSKQVCLEKYGVENINQLPEIRERIKQTCIERYGTENASQSEEIKEKIKQTNLEKYGVKNPFQSEEIKEKIKQICVEKYGVEYSTQVPEFKEKKIQSYLKNYGVENPMQSPEIKEKMKRNSLDKFGYDHPSKSLDVQKKQSNTRIVLMNRPTVLEIKKYKEKFNFKLIINWYCKKQEFLDDILKNIKMIYGELEYI